MINLSNSNEHTLSIRVHADGFCFAVHNPKNDSEYLFRPYPIDTTKPITANLKNAIEELELLNQSYQHTYLQIADGRYAITPKEFYSEQSARGLFAPNFTHIADRELILHNEVGDDNPAIILFGIDRSLHKLVHAHFTDVHIYHSITSLARFSIGKSTESHLPYCMVVIDSKEVTFLCVSNEEPMLVNTFPYSDLSDILFYILNCWQTLGLSQENVPLWVAGRNRQSTAFIKEAKTFIHTVAQVSPSNEFHASELSRIPNIPFDLQALIACE